MRVPVVALPVLIAVLTFGAIAAVPASAATAPVELGTAEAFAVLGASTVTNTGPTMLAGDLGLTPGTAVTGFPPGQVVGAVHVADAVAMQAQSDTTTAYNSAAGRPSDETVSADLAGRTLLPGVYSGATLALNGTLTLDGANDPDAVFIFQSGSSLITGPNSSVMLARGASACNVFWQVGSSATLGVGTSFQGTVAALTSITAQTASRVTGRLLARTGAVTLDTNTVSRPSCARAVAPLPAPASPSPSPSASPAAPASPSASPPASPSASPSASPPASPAASASPPAAASAGPAPSASPSSAAPAPTSPASATPAPVASPAPAASATRPASATASPRASSSTQTSPLPVPTQDSTSTTVVIATGVGPALPVTGIATRQLGQLGTLVLLLGGLLTLAGRRPRAATR